MAVYRRGVAVPLLLLALAGTTMGQLSCSSLGGCVDDCGWMSDCDCEYSTSVAGQTCYFPSYSDLQDALQEAAENIADDAQDAVCHMVSQVGCKAMPECCGLVR